MKHPKVTVLMPVYNGAMYLRQAVESILNQTFKDFELLIINDGSTDKSLSIIKEYDDPRIRLINNKKNLKLIATLNLGLSIARGQYIARMDCDDVSLPQRLEKQVEFMELNKDVGLCGSWIQFINNQHKGRIVKYPTEDRELKVRILFSNYFAHPSIIMRKSFLDKYNLRYSYEYMHVEDYDLWIRCSKDFKIANIDQILLRYRTGHDSISKKYCSQQKNNAEKLYEKNFRALGINNQVVLDILIGRRCADSSELECVLIELQKIIHSNIIYDNEILLASIENMIENISSRAFPRIGFVAMWWYYKHNVNRKNSFKTYTKVLGKFSREIYRYIKGSRWKNGKC